MAFADYTGKRSSVGRYELIEELGEGGMTAANGMFAGVNAHVRRTASYRSSGP